MLENIRIVLVETTHAGNIGAAARAMKTMGLSRLYLVAPQIAIDEQAIALSASANDVLENAVIVDSFSQAIADCTLVIGASARKRNLQNSLLEPKKCAEIVASHATQQQVAIVFGRERIGLTNQELLQCKYHLYIPTNPEYSSLNLAMAVQIVSYEIYLASLQQQSLKPQEITDYPTHSELEYFYQATEKLYSQLGFIHNDAVMLKLRRLYNRASLEKNELNILRGMLTAINKQLPDAKI